MEKVIFNRIGLGLKMDAFENESDYIENQNVIINGVELIPGMEHDLFDFFTEPVRYCGLLKGENSKMMVFYLGNETSLFGSTRYYSCLAWISPTRILNKYREGSARDFNFINGAWK